MEMRSPKDVYVILGERYYVERVIKVIMEKFGWFGGTIENRRVPRVRRYISHQIRSFPSLARVVCCRSAQCSKSFGTFKNV